MMEKLPVIYIAWHGNTAWTHTGQHTGLTDLPLTPDGERNAVRLGERLRGITFTKVFTSPMQRASRTCELAGFGAVAETDPDRVEWNYGKYEGLTSAQILQQRPNWDLFRDGARTVNRRHKSASGRTVSSNVSVISSATCCCFLADTLFAYSLRAGWASVRELGGRYLLLDPASLSAVGYEHNLSRPVIRLWNDDHHVERSMPIASHDQLQVSAAKGPTSGMRAMHGRGTLSDCRSEYGTESSRTIAL